MLWTISSLFAGEDLEDSHQPLVVSLGCHCAPSAYMSYFEVRQAAFPFDWMFTNDSKGFCQVLLNDFEAFLEEKNLEVHPFLPFVVVNTLYHIEFRHDFPTIGPHQEGSVLYTNWRDYIPSMKEKYLRRIERFRGLRKYRGKVYFIRMAYNSSKPYEWPKKITKNEAIDLHAVLTHYFPHTDFKLIVVNYLDEISEQEIIPWEIPGVENWVISEYKRGFEEIFRRLDVLPKSFEE